MKIMEWNINHRLGNSKTDMPNWVADEIRKVGADIVILTECCKKVPNMSKVIDKAFEHNKYWVFSSNNFQGGNNDVIIAVKRKIEVNGEEVEVEVISFNSFFSCHHEAPDHLQLKCKIGKYELIIVGIRIHAMNITDNEKRTQFEKILNNNTNEKSVIIAGDFNCNRRSFADKSKWNISAIDSIINDEYCRKTPDGASWARDVPSSDNHCFALDHFLVKGIQSFSLEPYNRDFTSREPAVYKWGKHFQTVYGWDKAGNNIANPYPDHAILLANFEL